MRHDQEKQYIQNSHSTFQKKTRDMVVSSIIWRSKSSLADQSLDSFGLISNVAISAYRIKVGSDVPISLPYIVKLFIL